MKTRRPWEGWILVGWTAVAAALLTAAVLGTTGVTADGVRVLIRSTARMSFALFTATFVASSVARLWPMPLTRWMLRNRRYLGVSFATSHAVHLAAIVAATRVIDNFRIDAITLTLGGLAYVFVAAMTVTSFDGMAHRIGRRWWVRLHKTGSYYLWAIFAFDYIGRAAASAAFLPLALVVAGSLALRVVAARPRRELARLQVTLP